MRRSARSLAGTRVLCCLLGALSLAAAASAATPVYEKESEAVWEQQLAARVRVELNAAAFELAHALWSLFAENARAALAGSATAGFQRVAQMKLDTVVRAECSREPALGPVAGRGNQIRNSPCLWRPYPLSEC